MQSHKTWFNNISGKLSGYGIWLRGQEINTLHESEYNNRDFSILFSRLSSYKDTSDSFTHRLLYQIAKDIPGVFPDMAFLPPYADTKFFDADKIPWMLPVKTKLHPKSFDLIGFSNSIVQELVNIPIMLAKSDIPLKKSERLSNAELPLIILGGANAINCSALFCDDPLVDGIFIGEETASIRTLLEICRDGKREKLNKREILDKLENIEGFFQPDKTKILHKKIKRQHSLHPEQLKDAPILYSDNADTGFLRISEGCPYFCSFCSESWNRKPYIEETAEILYQSAIEQKIYSGICNIDLFSFNFNIHSELYKILWMTSDLFANTGLKSQRFDHIAKHPEIIRLLQVASKSNITCGLEGISERMRKYLHKNLDNKILYQSLELLLKSHIRELKIFLIATGLETEEDYKDFNQLLQKIKQITQGQKHVPRIIFSVTPLVRFPHTPLEFEDAPDKDMLSKIIQTIELQSKINGFEMRSAANFNDYYLSQLLVRASDERISDILIQAIFKTKFVYYSTIPDSFIKELNLLLSQSGIDSKALLKGHLPNERKNKPWHIFDTGISPDFFEKVYNECVAFIESDSCFGTHKCSSCNACHDSDSIKKITHSTQPIFYLPEDIHIKLTTRKNNIFPVHFLISQGIAASGILGEKMGIALARALMLSNKSLAPFYFGYKNSFWDTENKGTWITGDNIITLMWEKPALEIFNNIKTDQNFVEKINTNLSDEWGKIQSIIEEIPKDISLYISGYNKNNLSEYLQFNHLKYTQKKNQDGGFVYELSKDSLKKDIVSSLHTTRDETVLKIGKKFNLEVFLKKCFDTKDYPKLSVVSYFK